VDSNLLDMGSAPKATYFDHKDFDISPNERYYDHTRVDFVPTKVGFD